LGRQKNIQLSGSVSHLVFYQLNGESYVRSKPTRVKQTKATHQRANDFGKASKIAKAIRVCASPILAFKPDRDLINRLNKAIYACICNNEMISDKSLPSLTGFEFNEKSELSARCKIKIPTPVIDHAGITIQLPAFNVMQKIVAPAFTKKINIKITGVGIDLKNPHVYNSSNVATIIEYNNTHIPAQQIKFPITINKGSLLLLLISLEYTTDKKIITDVRWLPASIVKAFVY
jgi:hypothetical protein